MCLYLYFSSLALSLSPVSSALPLCLQPADGEEEEETEAGASQEEGGSGGEVVEQEEALTADSQEESESTGPRKSPRKRKPRKD